MDGGVTELPRPQKEQLIVVGKVWLRLKETKQANGYERLSDIRNKFYPDLSTGELKGAAKALDWYAGKIKRNGQFSRMGGKAS